MGSLTSLRRLDLYSNRLTGSIPAELGSLTSLGRLDLYRNWLTGSIPAELGSLTNLEYLDLYHNRLTGEIPAELGDLTKLEGLWLSFNFLTGEIPAELGDLSNLEYPGNQPAFPQDCDLFFILYRGLQPSVGDGLGGRPGRPLWGNPQMAGNAPMGEWDGVINSDGRVTGLYLSKPVEDGLGNLVQPAVLCPSKATS